MALDPTDAVGVVGSGTMGAGIAEVAARAGHPVRLVDVELARAQAARDGIASRLRAQAAKGRLDPAEAERMIGRIEAVGDLADLAGCALVVEAAAESLEVKRAVFGRLEQVCPADAVLATNTSSISVTAIAALLEHPGRVVGMHFFNPAPAMRLVEVVTGLATDPSVAEAVAETARAWGKVAVLTTSSPGFIVNRVARPYYGEALRVHEESGLSPAVADQVMREAGGFRMGPFELMDLIGLDVNLAVSTSVWQATHHDPRYTPSTAQRELVDAGRLGRKSGGGWYDAAAPQAAPEPVADNATAPDHLTVHGEPGLLGPLVTRLEEAGVKIGYGDPVARPHLELPDGTVVVACVGRTATEECALLGRPAAVLDLALDLATATHLGVATAGPGASTAVAGMLRAAAIEPVGLPDVAGLLVTRTVAMLVNEAADLVGRGVASAADVDLAMRYGVNYPVGPLAWGDRLGAAHVVAVLDRLADHYRDGRHRPAPLLRRLALTGGRLSAPDPDSTEETA